MAWGFRGVWDDLTELGRHIPDIAYFLHPLHGPAHTDSPPTTPTGCRSPSPRPVTQLSPSIIASILEDLAKIGGSFTGGFARRALPDHPQAFPVSAASAATAELPRTASSPPAAPVRCSYLSRFHHRPTP
ncbi:hypothetical protein E2562_024587 [Oryza meyeriana var. granulata]|uniref:Uncharacterized protein n=1 Tax=Oryza meyeriana var. granulata TaxID=110450 RepID=A0A6G1DLK1_9ORYZ|nr:hypothetical protein E2562_024587 [Oryza meyeriana var. granulata]